MIPHALHPTTITLRPKNQLTLPADIVSKIGAHIGQRFLVELKGTSVLLLPLPESFAGSLAEIYNTTEDTEAYIENERSSWE